MRKFLSILIATGLFSGIISINAAALQAEDTEIPISYTIRTAMPDATMQAEESNHPTSYTIQDASEAIAFYENVKSQPEWVTNQSRIERGEMVQLPDTLLQNMSTDALIEAVLEYPFFIDVYCFNDTQTGMDIMYDTFNGLRELAARTDAAQALLQKYESEPVLMTASADADTFRLTSMEILLAQDYIAEKMTAEESARLYELCTEKYAQKQESELYGGFNTVFFDLTETEVPEE